MVKSILSLMILSSLLLFSCNPLKKMIKRKNEVTIATTPEPLELRGDSIKFRVEGSFPPKYFHKKVSADLTPVLAYGDNQEEALESFSLKGQMVEKEGAFEIDYEKGGNFAHVGTFPYKQGMEKAVLKLKVKGDFKGKTKELYSRDLVEGTMVTALLVENDARVILGKDDFRKQYSRETKGKINYVVNRSNVRSSELKGNDILEMIKNAKEWKGNDKISVKEIRVDGYASPEGEVNRNNELGDLRSKTGSSAIRKIFSRNQTVVEDNQVSLTAHGEDWDGFKSLMQSSSIEDKDKIVNLIALKSDPLEREAEIKKVAVIYKEIKKYILPPLRRAEVSIISTHENLTDQEMMGMVNESKVNELRKEQMVYSANKLFANDTKKQELIYKAFIDKFSDDWRGYNNLGVIVFNSGDLDKAKEMFNKALLIEKKDVVYNNLGAIEKKKGNFDEALKLFDKAAGAGNEVIENMGSIYIKRGEYSKSSASYNGVVSFNSALNALLTGSIASADDIASKIKDSDNPKLYYLKAIIAARQEDSPTAASSLKAAIGRDKSLLDKAKNDIEFKKFRKEAVMIEVLGE